MSWCQEGLANSNQVPGFHHQNPPPALPPPPDVPGPPAVHQGAPPPPPTFQQNPLPPVPPELAPVNRSLPPDRSLIDQTLSHVPLPGRDHVPYTEEPAKSTDPIQNGTLQKSANGEKSQSSELGLRKRVKRVSKEQLESIIVKRLREELSGNEELVRLQETCCNLVEEVKRWKTKAEELAAESARLQRLISSPGSTSRSDVGKVSEDPREGDAGRSRQNDRSEEESLPPLPARLSSNDSLPTPILSLTQTQLGLEVFWNFEGDHNVVASYELFAFRKLTLKSSPQPPPAKTSWMKVGDVKSIPLPIRCTLSQFKSGSTYSFAVRSKDLQGGVGRFSDVKVISLT